MRYHPSKLELEALAGTIAAVVFTSVGPPSGPAKFAAGTKSGPKLYVVLALMCCPALYINPPSGPAGGLF